MQIHNLTQSHARNDTINCRIHGFSFRDFEDKDGIQDVISHYSLDQFLISNTPRTQKRVKKVKISKTLRFWCLDSSILIENPRVVFPLRRTFEFIDELGITVGCNGQSKSTAEMMRRLVNQCD